MNSNFKETSQYSEPFDNLNRTISTNLNNIFNSSNSKLTFNSESNNLLVVKNIKSSSRNLQHNRVSKNIAENNRLFYNFNNQNNSSPLPGSYRLNKLNFSTDHLAQRPATYFNEQIPTPSQDQTNRLTRIDLNSTNNSISVPSTPSNPRKPSSKSKHLNRNNSVANQPAQQLKENKQKSSNETKTTKESFMNRLFNRSKSNSNKQAHSELVVYNKPIESNRSDSISRYSNITQSRSSGLKACFPTAVLSSNSQNLSNGYESPSNLSIHQCEFEKTSSKCGLNSSLVAGGVDLMSSGYESLSKDNTTNSGTDDSSDCLTTASSVSGDVKYTTLNRIKSGKS